MPSSRPAVTAEKALAAKASLRRKTVQTPLEDALAADDGARAAMLIQWAQKERNDYIAGLTTWRSNRAKYESEAKECFEHRRLARERHSDGRPDVFEVQNDSLNFIGGLAEFASAQAEQDIFGSDPWFAAIPVGNNDAKLAETLQRHLQWKFRDQRLNEAYCRGVSLAAGLGESFTLNTYQTEVDEYERAVECLHANGKPVIGQDGELITTDEAALAIAATLKGKPKLDWKTVFTKQQEVIFDGVETALVHYNDIAFREDAPALDLRWTNVYITQEISVLMAKQRFNLSNDDAINLAKQAEVKASMPPSGSDRTAINAAAQPVANEPLGADENDRMLNTRVRVCIAFAKCDPFGDGQARRLCFAFAPDMDNTTLLWADYLGNVSPKSELPVKAHTWEFVPHRLYGRGFFEKYAAVQTFIDDYWNQINFRNRMHSTPIGGYHDDAVDQEEDDGDLELKPGTMKRLKAGKKLADWIEFMEFPELDSQSKELLQIAIQMAQLRSGISSASQGDLSGVPESNTATGVRQLMSRAAVLLKKPVRTLRRSFGRDFSYVVKLLYTNLDRDETFVWGEGDAAELLTLSAEQVRGLDIDVKMLLTQEQNANKLEGAQAAIQFATFFVSLVPADRVTWWPIVEQGLKALEYDGVQNMPKPTLTIQDCIAVLPPDQAALLQSMIAQMQQLQAPQIPNAPQTQASTQTP